MCLLFGKLLIDFFVSFGRSSSFYEAENNGGYFLLLFSIAVLFVNFLWNDDIRCKNKSSNAAFNMAAYGAVSQTLALRFSLFTRVAMYGFTGFYILIPNLLFKIGEKFRNRSMAFLFDCVFSLVLLIMFLITSQKGHLQTLNFFFS